MHWPRILVMKVPVSVAFQTLADGRLRPRLPLLVQGLLVSPGMTIDGVAVHGVPVGQLDWLVLEPGAGGFRIVGATAVSL